LGLGLGKLLEENFLLTGEIELLEHDLDGFRAASAREAVLAIFVLGGEKFVFGEELVLLKGGQARLKNDIALEVEDALKLLELHVEQKADAARKRLQEPDVSNGRGQLDMAHALAADL